MKVVKTHLVRVHRDDIEYLKKMKLLKCIKGQYPDMQVVNRQSKHKRYYINERLLKYLREDNQK